MPESTDWRPPPGVDVNVPSAARIYDYSLGGAHNFAADRAAAHELFQAYPDAPLVGRANRAFLQRAVRFCYQRGITQFLDLGSGIPTVGNVHETAQELDPACRVVYVDNEPVAVAHTLQLLEGVPNAAIVHADIRDVDAVLGAPQTKSLLDFHAPIALMMVAVLHYISPEDDISGLIGALHLGPSTGQSGGDLAHHRGPAARGRRGDPRGLRQDSHPGHPPEPGRSHRPVRRPRAPGARCGLDAAVAAGRLVRAAVRPPGAVSHLRGGWTRREADHRRARLVLARTEIWIGLPSNPNSWRSLRSMNRM